MTPKTIETQTKEPKVVDSVIDQFKNDLKADVSEISETETDVPICETVLPELKGLEILKEGTYAIDPEKTITNMVEVVKRMESQLKEALKINSNLEKDLDDSKEMIIDLRSEKKEVQETVKRMEAELPSKRELKMEIECLVDERSSAQRKIRDLNLKIKEIKNMTKHYENIISEFKEDKKDSKVEADYLVAKLDSLIEKSKQQADEIKKLNREKLSAYDKLKKLEHEFKKADEQSYKFIGRS